MGFRKLFLGFEIDRRSGYSVVDVVRVFRILSERPMGRVLLVEELGLGEATVKTMTKNLRKHGLTRDSTRGEVLTEKGGRVSDYLNRKVSKAFRVKVPSISKKPTVALIVRNAAGKVRMGIEQRDEGMKVGVNVTTLVFRNRQATFPGTGEVVKGLESLEAGDRDVIIIASGENANKAERGGIAAALTLM
jgi:predicted transcriptional regulator